MDFDQTVEWQWLVDAETGERVLVDVKTGKEMVRWSGGDNAQTKA